MSAHSLGDLRRPGAVLLVSCYELGRQPQALALAQAFLERAGFQPAALDLSVDPLEPEKVRRARFIGISVPMHTALRLGMQTARRLREIHRNTHICFFGHYAVLHAEVLLRGLADSVLGGELEEDLVARVEALARGAGTAAVSADGVSESDRAQPSAGLAADARSAATRGKGNGPVLPSARLERLDFPVPSRGRLPRLERYAHLVHGGRHVVAGQVEATRGCLHHCGHCPIPAVYGGRIFVIPAAVVLADIRAQVDAGARHISFADADFLNGPSHVLRIVRAMHAEFPALTFDFTAKIEHVLRNHRLMPELASLGALFMVSAVESLSDRVLEILDKGHTRADVLEAMEILRDAGIVMRPSLLPFTPWSTRADFEALLDFVLEQDLIDCIDPVQYTIRLLVPPGSLLIQHPEMRPHLGNFDESALTHRWSHADPAMDRLQADLAVLVEQAATAGEDGAVTFERIRALAETSPAARVATGARAVAHVARAAHLSRQSSRRHERPPRLTEPWFC